MNIIGRPRWAELFEQENRQPQSQPITIAALEAMGFFKVLDDPNEAGWYRWEPTSSKAQCGIDVAIDANRFLVAVTQSFYPHQMGRQIVDLPGCKTMQQLTALIEMLEGES